jgi:hypothetical protein
MVITRASSGAWRLRWYDAQDFRQGRSDDSHGRPTRNPGNKRISNCMETINFKVLSGNTLVSDYALGDDSGVIRCVLKPEVLLGRIGGLSQIGCRWSAQKIGEQAVIQGLSKDMETALRDLRSAIENWPQV